MCNICGKTSRLTAWPITGKLRDFNSTTMKPLTYPAHLVYCCNGLNEKGIGQRHTPNFAHLSDLSNKNIIFQDAVELREYLAARQSVAAEPQSLVDVSAS